MLATSVASEAAVMPPARSTRATGGLPATRHSSRKYGAIPKHRDEARATAGPRGATVRCRCCRSAARHQISRVRGSEGEVVVSEEELGDLFKRYASYVATIGIRLLGRDDELDDLVQEVFIEAYRGYHQLRSPDAVKAWLARITVRRAVRRLRRRRLRSFFSLEALPRGRAAGRRRGHSRAERGDRVDLSHGRAPSGPPARGLGAQARRGRDAGLDRRDLPRFEGDRSAAVARRRARVRGGKGGRGIEMDDSRDPDGERSTMAHVRPAWDDARMERNFSRVDANGCTGAGRGGGGFRRCSRTCGSAAQLAERAGAVGRRPVDAAERRHVQAERLHDRDVEVRERLVAAAGGADRARAAVRACSGS